MSDADIAILGASNLAEGVPVWQANVPVGNDNNDVEPFDHIDVFQALGVTSLPFPKDESGYAEAVVMRNVGGRDGIVVGARDTRTAKIVGKMVPGDTVVHSTGPNPAAQLQLKEKKKQVVLATKDNRDRTMAVILDGKNEKFQIAVLGAMIEIDKNGDISVCNASGAGFAIQGNKFHVLGELSLPGMMPGMALMQGPPNGQVPPQLAALLPVMGVSK